MKSYKALFLDWDDTIGDFSNAAVRSLREIYDLYALDRCFDSFDQYLATYSPHNIHLWERYGRDEVTKEYLEFDRFFFPQMVAPRPLSMDQAAANALRMCKDHLHHTTEFFAPLPGATEAVRRLAERYPLVIVSNGFVEVQYEKIRRSGLQSCFRHVILSEEVGCQKPNPRIYQSALERCGLRPDEVLMIGDSWYSDIFGAQQAGIDQAWILPDPSRRQPDQSATYIFSSLSDLLTAL